jgi:hypothetical protein
MILAKGLDGNDIKNSNLSTKLSTDVDKVSFKLFWLDLFFSDARCSGLEAIKGFCCLQDIFSLPGKWKFTGKLTGILFALDINREI